MTVPSSQQTVSTSSGSAEKRYERFIEWTRQHGAYFHPSLKFIVTPNRGAEVVVTGKGIKPFETLFTVPYGISLSYFNAVSAGVEGSSYQPHSESLPQEYLRSTSDHDTINAIFLVQQYLLGEKSFWYP
jgi:histone-lysine N-methyltransferase SETD3